MAKPPSAKRAISLPADMDRRMRKFPDVNWSEVAQLAFESKLKELAPKPKDKNPMTKMIERLRASAIEESAEFQSDGHRDGAAWAAETATKKDLQRLERLYHGDLEDLLQHTDAELIASTAIAEAIIGDQDIGDFWEITIGDNYEPLLKDMDYLRGFVTGAVEAWKLVKNQV